MVSGSHGTALALTILVLLGKDSDEVGVCIPLAFLTIDELAKESEIDRSSSKRRWATALNRLRLSVMLQEYLGVRVPKERQRSKALSLRLLAMHASNRKPVKMRFHEFSECILRAAFWDVTNVYLHGGYTRLRRDGGVGGGERDGCG